MIEIIRLWRRRIIIQPRTLALNIGPGSTADSGEHNHHDGELLGLAILQNQLRITERIPAKQFPLGVRQKIERFSLSVDKVPAVRTDTDRSRRCLKLKNSKTQSPSRCCLLKKTPVAHAQRLVSRLLEKPGPPAAT